MYLFLLKENHSELYRYMWIFTILVDLYICICKLCGNEVKTERKPDLCIFALHPAYMQLKLRTKVNKLINYTLHLQKMKNHEAWTPTPPPRRNKSLCFFFFYFNLTSISTFTFFTLSVDHIRAWTITQFFDINLTENATKKKKQIIHKIPFENSN